MVLKNSKLKIKSFLILFLAISSIYVAFFLILFKYFITKENSRQFKNISLKNCLLLQKKIEETLIPIEILKNLDVTTMDETKYNEIVETFLNTNSSLTSVIWAPKISNEKLWKFKREIKNYVKRDYKIFKINSGVQEGVEKKNSYYPIYRISPSYLKKNMLGYELSSELEIFNLVSNFPTMKSTIFLNNTPKVFEDSYKNKLSMLTPVYSKGYGVPRIDRMHGFLLSILDLEKLIDSLNLDKNLISIDFYDTYGNLIFSSNSSIKVYSKKFFSYDGFVKIGGERLRIVFSTPFFNINSKIYMFHIAFFVFNLLIVVFLGASINYRYLHPDRRLKELVALKTHELKSNCEKLQRAIKESQLGTLDWDIQSGNILLDKKSKLLLNEKNLDGFKIENFYKMIHPDDLKVLREKLEKLFTGTMYSCELEMRLYPKTGTEYWVFFRGNVYEKNNNGNPLKFFGTMLDISPSKHLEKTVLIDPLTKIYNKRYIINLLKNRQYLDIGSQEIFTLAILDIDHFKKVNDTYGHPAGDYILREFSKFIKGNIRPSDIIARYGGEEFVVIFKNVDRYTCYEIVERIKWRIQEKVFKFDSNVIKVTFSCGLSDLTEVSNLLKYSDLLKIADDRLYVAKNDGRNLIVND